MTASDEKVKKSSVPVNFHNKHCGIGDGAIVRLIVIGHARDLSVRADSILMFGGRRYLISYGKRNLSSLALLFKSFNARGAVVAESVLGWNALPAGLSKNGQSIHMRRKKRSEE